MQPNSIVERANLLVWKIERNKCDSEEEYLENIEQVVEYSQMLIDKIIDSIDYLPE